MSFTKLSPLGFTTVEELAVWRQRRNNGPYRVRGDAPGGQYSPGDWLGPQQGTQRIVDSKNAFMNNPASFLWAGPNSWGRYPGPRTGCVGDVGKTGGAPWIRNGYVFGCAAFFAVVENNHTVAARVGEFLGRQVNHADTQFGNRNRYCLNSGPRNDSMMFAWPGDWLGAMIGAFDFICGHETEHGCTVISNKAAFRKWAADWGEWNEAHQDRTKSDYSNWSSHDGANGAGWNISAQGNNSSGNRLFDGGPVIDLANLHWNNRAVRGQSAGALAAILDGRTALINSYKKLWRAAIMYGYFGDLRGDGMRVGAWTDFYRGFNADKTKGTKYSFETVSGLVTTAETLWRANGDASLLNFSTTAGHAGSQGQAFQGGPKTLGTLCNAMYRYVNGKARVKWGGGWTNPGTQRWHDLFMIHVNRHYKDPMIRDTYTRRTGPNFPESPNGGGFVMGPADRMLTPSALFQFGDVQETVFEGGGGGPTAPAPPVLSPSSGIFQTAQTVSVTSSGATSIRYTRGPLDPTLAAPNDAGTDGTLYSGPITNVSDETLKVRGYNANGASPVGRGDYDVVPLPGAATITPNGGTFSSAVDAVVSASDADEMIYTLDGFTPTASNGTRVAVGFGIRVAQTSTLKTRGLNASGVGPVASADFVIGAQPPPPTILLDGAAVSGSVSKSGPGTITAVLPAGYETAELRYTTGPTVAETPDPTSSSPVLPTAGIRIGRKTAVKVTTVVP